jgi:hypothetical protein
MKHPGHTYGGFVPSISERGMTEIISERGAASHIQKVHPPQKIIGNLNEILTQSSRLAHLSCFTNTHFVALFELRDV